MPISAVAFFSRSTRGQTAAPAGRSPADARRPASRGAPPGGRGASQTEAAPSGKELSLGAYLAESSTAQSLDLPPQVLFRGHLPLKRAVFKLD